ncbi:hypothetical protein [Pontibacter qinzhouensis]|uniref:hypothetical protein n=1 Tax=Pontibacter qinzhouensis TaxID=2603253 RepID=UPI00164FFF1D|nr:hypothetical protein [Pontibacter qinzhouensis]
MTSRRGRRQQIRKRQEAELTYRLRNALADIELFKKGTLKTWSMDELLAAL